MPAPARAPDESPRLPAEPSLWFFILADMSVFALFFLTYLWDLGNDRASFASEAASLSTALGLSNTLMLLTSSFLVVRATDAHRRQDSGLTDRLLSGALAMAAAFAGTKFTEYGMAWKGGHSLTSSSFYMYYFALTGLHLLHVAIGNALLSTWRRSLRSTAGPCSTGWAESSAGYWHMVDLLWLLIFSFLYVGGRVA